MRVAWPLGLALVLVPSGAAAQAPILAAVNRMFEGMREADGAKVRDGFAEGARFAAVDESDRAEPAPASPGSSDPAAFSRLRSRAHELD